MDLMKKILLIASIFLGSSQFSVAESFYATTFEIRTTVKDKCLDVRGYSGKKGKNVMIWDCQSLPDQRWYLADPTSGKPISPSGFTNFMTSRVFEIRNAQTGLCLDIDGYNGRPDDSAMIWDCQNLADQTWEYWHPYFNAPYSNNTSPGEGDAFRLRNQLQQPKYNRPTTCLDVAGSSGSSGNNVQLWRCDDVRNVDDQVWIRTNTYSEVLTH